jgi:hypothetical protein
LKISLSSTKALDSPFILATFANFSKSYSTAAPAVETFNSFAGYE